MRVFLCTFLSDYKKGGMTMRIRGKLACSFLLIILLPTLLLLGATRIIYQVQLQSLADLDADLTDVTTILSNPVQFMNGMTEDEFKELKNTAEHTPDVFLQQKYQESVEKKLTLHYSFLVVKQDDRYIYKGNETMFRRVASRLPSGEELKAVSESGTYVGGDDAFLVKSHSFSFSDGSVGTVYVITLVSGWVPAIKAMFFQFVLCLLAILLFTASILLLWIYGGMVRPISILKKATHRIRDGELDFSIDTRGQDEISALCKDFEEMRVRLQESVEMRMRYEKEFRDLVSNISHDLKTPLTAIEGYTEGILDGVASTPEKQEKYLRTIYAKAKQMETLVDELSMGAKIENGIVPYHFRNVGVRDYFDDCVEELRFDLDMQRIRVIYENAVAEDVRVEMDLEQLRRVINNIVGNSVKYLDQQEGTILIRIVDMKDLPQNIDYADERKEEKARGKAAAKDSKAERISGQEQTGKEEKGRRKGSRKEREEKKIPGTIRVEFTDTGRGIDPEALPHIFERFYREDASRNSSTGGSGLGLAIAAKIIEDHGGRIWAESVKGQGTSIYFTLCKEETDSEQ